MTCDFSKQRIDSTLRVAWDGNIAVVSCDNCCMRWFITIDGQECSDPGPIDIAIRQDQTELDEDIWYDDYRPASVVGYCCGNESGGFVAISWQKLENLHSHVRIIHTIASDSEEEMVEREADNGSSDGDDIKEQGQEEVDEDGEGVQLFAGHAHT